MLMYQSDVLPWDSVHLSVVKAMGILLQSYHYIYANYMIVNTIYILMGGACAALPYVCITVTWLVGSSKLKSEFIQMRNRSTSLETLLVS